MNVDLFGQPVVVEKDRKTTKPNGYAARPGSGPAGMTCLDCAHYCRVHRGNGVFRKCLKMEAKWTRGAGSDILARSPACRWFEQEEVVA